MAATASTTEQVRRAVALGAGLVVLVLVTRTWKHSVNAAASRQQDLRSTTLPGQLILFLPYLVSIFANEEVKTAFSMLPIGSTMIMPGRMAEGSVPWWQVAVATALTVAAAAVFVRVGSRMFEQTLLRTGTKPGYREAFPAQRLTRERLSRHDAQQQS